MWRSLINFFFHPLLEAVGRNIRLNDLLRWRCYAKLKSDLLQPLRVLWPSWRFLLISPPTPVCFPGSVAEGGGGVSPPEALGKRTGPKGRHGEGEELQPHQRQHGALYSQPTWVAHVPHKEPNHPSLLHDPTDRPWYLHFHWIWSLEISPPLIPESDDQSFEKDEWSWDVMTKIFHVQFPLPSSHCFL